MEDTKSVETPSIAKTMMVDTEARLPSRFGDFRVVSFTGDPQGREHLALIRGDVRGREDVPVRLHSECLTGDVLGSLRCDCRDQLIASLETVGKMERGVVLYLRQEGRGIGLTNKIRAYALQDQGLDTVEANERLGFKPDQRDYGIGVQILKDLGVKSMRLLSNNPRKLVGLEGYGLSVAEWIPLEIQASVHTERYLKTKKDKLGHRLKGV